jgi:hypothetical protein
MMAKTIETVVSEIAKKILPAANLLDKAKAVYDWVSNNIKYDHKRKDAIKTSHDCHIRHPEETLRKGKGVCTDCTRLYIELVRHFGVHAEMAEVNNGKHVVVAIPLKNGYFFVDPTDPGEFDAHYEEYCFVPKEVYESQETEDDSEEEKGRINYENQTVEVNNMYRTNEGPKSVIGTAIAVIGLAGMATLFYGWLEGTNSQKRKTIQAMETSNAITFHTPSGSITYTIAPEARKEWQTLLFFEEARLGTELSDADKFELCKKTDRTKEDGQNGERELRLDEIIKARQESERNY